MSWIITIFFILVLIVGYINIRRKIFTYTKRLVFASEYRGKFVSLANQYVESIDGWTRSGNLNLDLYHWLTLNVHQIQSDLGVLGVMDFVAPFQIYRARNFQIVVNTLPKFRDNTIDDFFITSVDDCLLRHIGLLTSNIETFNRQVKNPLVWFRVGIQLILTIPLVILNSFGLLTDNTTSAIKGSIFYKLISGFVALVALVSGIVTIVVGYDQSIAIFSKWLKAHF